MACAAPALGVGAVDVDVGVGAAAAARRWPSCASASACSAFRRSRSSVGRLTRPLRARSSEATSGSRSPRPTSGVGGLCGAQCLQHDVVERFAGGGCDLDERLVPPGVRWSGA
jgi:hypothetical protein